MRKLFWVLPILATSLFLLTLPGARPAESQTPAVINLIQLPADNSAEVYYAQDLGYFKEAGLDVRITSMTNSAAIIAALAGGSGDIGNSVIGAAAQAREHGIPVRFIAPAGLYVDATPTSALLILKDSPIKTAAQLDGKTIGISGLNDLTYYATRGWIDKNGGDSTKVKFVELPFPTMNAALEQRRIDAAYNIEPFMTASLGRFKVLGRAGSGVALRYQATGWVATDAWLQTHADVALRFAAVIRRTAIWANAHHKESAAILLKYTRISPDVAEKMNRVEYALTLQPNLIQPPIDAAAKYGGGKAIPASDLIWSPAR